MVYIYIYSKHLYIHIYVYMYISKTTEPQATSSACHLKLLESVDPNDSPRAHPPRALAPRPGRPRAVRDSDWSRRHGRPNRTAAGAAAGAVVRRPSAASCAACLCGAHQLITNALRIKSAVRRARV